MKKKLSLSELRVQSYVTTTSPAEVNAIEGGLLSDNNITTRNSMCPAESCGGGCETHLVLAQAVPAV
jgi:hypothetical protein